MNRKIISVICIVVIAFTVYFFAGNNTSDSTKQETENIKDLVNEYTVGSVKAKSASITAEELIVTNSDESKSIYALPEEEFFVSIAPYIENTHPCSIHSLTGCQGELVNKEFKVYIEDEEGNVVLDDILTSQANGFIDLWVPRDNNYRVTIDYDGKKVESTFSTFKGDNTCITTMQLT